MDEPALLQRRIREIEAVHRLVGLSPPREPLWWDCPVELERFAELSLGHRFDSVGVMTRGLGRDFLGRLAQRIREWLGDAAARPELELLAEVVRLIPRPSVFLKVEEGAAGLDELSWYFTEGQAAAAVQGLLAELQVAAGPRDAVARLTGELEAELVFLGRSIRRDGRSRYAVYLPLQGARQGLVQRRLFGVLRRLVADPDLRDLVRLHHDHLLRHERARVFVSLAFPGAQTPTVPGLKLDYEGPLRSSLEALLADLGWQGAVAEGFAKFLELLGAAGPGYLGLRLAPGAPGLRLYVPRDPVLLW